MPLYRWRCRRRCNEVQCSRVCICAFLRLGAEPLARNCGSAVSLRCAHPHACLIVVPISRICASAQAWVPVDPGHRLCASPWMRIAGFTDSCVSRRGRAALVCCASSRRRRLAPRGLSSLTPARAACPPGDRLAAHPRRAALGAPWEVAEQAAPDRPAGRRTSWLRRPDEVAFDDVHDLMTTPRPWAGSRSRRQAAQRGARRTPVNPRPAPASPVLGV